MGKRRRANIDEIQGLLPRQPRAYEGWVRIDDVDTVPTGFTAQATEERIDFCGCSWDRELFLV